MEPEATVLGRKKDEALLKKAVEGAKKQYTGISGRDIDVTVDASLSNSG